MYLDEANLLIVFCMFSFYRFVGECWVFRVVVYAVVLVLFVGT